MPELPEVEVVRRGLARHVRGRDVAEVEVLHERAVRRHPGGAADAVLRMTGARLVDAVRRGKYLWLPLERDGAVAEALVVHLGMSGQLLVEDRSAPEEKHLRARWRFSDGGAELRFVDQRTFGGIAVVPLVPAPDGGRGGHGEAEDGPHVPMLPAPVAHIARDPLDPAFDDTAFVQRLRRRSTGVKRALLDQTLVSGVGNIYADEALWRARLHGARPTDRLTRSQVSDLLDGVRDVLGGALAQGGTSFDSLYVDVNGQSGYFSRFLAVYGQGDRPCPRCGTPIRRESFMNRSSYSCPQCQPRPRARRA